MLFRSRYLALIVTTLAVPLSAVAHEVYVLPKDVITQGVSTPGFSLLTVLGRNLSEFFLWAFVGALTVFIVFSISISRTMERIFDPMLAVLPKYAPLIGRITIGLSFIAAAYYQSLFGPELPLVEIFGVYAPFATTVLVTAGSMIAFGVYTRLAAIAALMLFCVAVSVNGLYMLTYTNYVGELILLTLLGGHRIAVHHVGHDAKNLSRDLRKLKGRLTPYAFLVLRVTFGISLLYASIYAKVVHDGLALAVASMPLAGHATSLASVFGFEPHFLVLGAAIVEIVIGVFFILGIEIRFTSMFLLFWLSLSLMYFGEVVWPHIVLIGIPIAFIAYGYDKYSLEGWLFKSEGREPVL